MAVVTTVFLRSSIEGFDLMYLLDINECHLKLTVESHNPVPVHEPHRSRVAHHPSA